MSVINKVLGLFLGNKYERDMKEISPYVEKIQQEFASLTGLSNDELRDQTALLREEIKKSLESDENEIKLLRVIKALRQENYTTQCICRMLKNLKTKSEGNDIFLSEETEDPDDRLLSSLYEAESNAKELIGYMEYVHNKGNAKKVDDYIYWFH